MDIRAVLNPFTFTYLAIQATDLFDRQRVTVTYTDGDGPEKSDQYIHARVMVELVNVERHQDGFIRFAPVRGTHPTGLVIARLDYRLVAAKRDNTTGPQLPECTYTANLETRVVSTTYIWGGVTRRLIVRRTHNPLHRPPPHGRHS